jgi:hypothetical protein
MTALITSSIIHHSIDLRWGGIAVVVTVGMKEQSIVSRPKAKKGTHQGHPYKFSVGVPFMGTLDLR